MKRSPRRGFVETGFTPSVWVGSAAIVCRIALDGRDQSSRENPIPRELANFLLESTPKCARRDFGRNDKATSQVLGSGARQEAGTCQKLDIVGTRGVLIEY